MTRINRKYARTYLDGYDVSGYARDFGNLGWDYEFQPDNAFTDGCKNVITGKPTISADGMSAFLDNDTAGLFVQTKAVATRSYAVVFGTNAAPVAGDPMFAWEFEQNTYKQESGNGFAVVGVGLGNASYASELTYGKPWGVVVSPKTTWTAANTAIGIDDNGAASTAGGLFVYHLFSSDGTVTLTLEEASTNTNPNFAALSGATSGSITAAVTPKHGIVALGTTAAVKRYIRPQITLGTATTLVAFFGFIRGT